MPIVIFKTLSGRKRTGMSIREAIRCLTLFEVPGERRARCAAGYEIRTRRKGQIEKRVGRAYRNLGIRLVSDTLAPNPLGARRAEESTSATVMFNAREIDVSTLG